MFSKVMSCAVLGVNGVQIHVEADVNDGLPVFTMVGYLSSSVKEAGERVRTALKNSGYHVPPKRITINLSPANLKKDGSGFDLPIAVAVLLATGITPALDMEEFAVVGELSLNGGQACAGNPAYGKSLSCVRHIGLYCTERKRKGSIACAGDEDIRRFFPAGGGGVYSGNFAD